MIGSPSWRWGLPASAASLLKFMHVAKLSFVSDTEKKALQNSVGLDAEFFS